MKLKIYSVLFIFAVISTVGRAGTINWDGSENPDYSWTNGDNWVGGTTPVNGDFGDFARFTETYSGSKTPNVNGSRTVQGVIFDNSAGWTLTGSELRLRTINSTGAGLNLMNNVKSYNGSNQNWNIGTGNTLEINNLYLDGSSRTVTINGGGYMKVNSAIDGFSSGRTLRINDATVQVNSGDGFTGSGGSFRINDPTAVLRLNNSVSNVQALIGSSILDDTTLGLVVTDAGGGFSEVSVFTIPEPSTAVLLLISGLTVVCVLRKRKN